MSPLDAPAAHPHRQVWIPLPDGKRLSARLWLPALPEEAKAPAVVEWIPYRSTDATAIGDSTMHGWFAGQGIAALRIDIRGSGNSDGALRDEYLAQEQDDAVAAIAWIADQPWCNGAVGMIGISWGGFAALQIAARRPPALKAIITACSTDDRYRDDVHFMGGCLLNDGISWGSGLLTQIARPPDPAYAGDSWRNIWLERLGAIEPPLATWLAHPRRDGYWRHASVCEDYAAIRCPVFAVGGWTDGYSDAILRLMQSLDVPRRALIGPWTHVYPNFGVPGPAIGFLQECLGWWRRWLFDAPAAQEEEPLLQLWIGEKLAPSARMPTIEGRWATLAGWPIEHDKFRFGLAPGRLHPGEPGAPQAGDSILVASPQDCGAAGGEWCPLDGGGHGPEFQTDQSSDDGRSVCFDSAPLPEPVEILGAPVLRLRVSIQTPAAVLAARLCEVMPDGRSARITFGLLRFERPAGITGGAPFDLALRLKAVGYRFQAGARIRLAISSAYWPMAWPEPIASPWALHPGESGFELPLHLRASEGPPPAFEAPEAAAALPHDVLAPEQTLRVLTRDLGAGDCSLQARYSRPTIRIDDLAFGGRGLESYRIPIDDPGGAVTEMEREAWFGRGPWQVKIASRTSLRFVDGALALTSWLEASEDGEIVFVKTWEHRFARDRGS